jgi:hypothetical protein
MLRQFIFTSVENVAAAARPSGDCPEPPRSSD